jgi:nicotinate phosphoribosyltransferase
MTHGHGARQGYWSSIGENFCFWLESTSLIATKANRIVRAAQGRPVLEFGSRRAAGGDAAVLGARAAFIGGCAGTACTLTDRKFNVPAVGTMSHSWVQMFDSEYEALLPIASVPQQFYPTGRYYNVFKWGPNAIDLQWNSKRLAYLLRHRLDSGDLAYLSKKQGFYWTKPWTDLPYCRLQCPWTFDFQSPTPGAKIDSFGGGTLITSKSEPVFVEFTTLCIEDSIG